MLWKVSEGKLEQLQRYLDEVRPSWNEWETLDSNSERRDAWLQGAALVPDSLQQELSDRVSKGKEETKKLGAQGPPEKHSFTIHHVAEKILPQKNLTERQATARKFLEAEIEGLDPKSNIRAWLEETQGKRTTEKTAWWVWVELLVRMQETKGRFRQGNRWKENLAERRRENRPEGRWREFD